MTEKINISSGDKTLWGFTKQKLQELQGEGAKITNQQIVDAMKAIAKANGQEDGDFDKYAAGNFKAGNEIVVPGFHIEHGKVAVTEDAAETETTEEMAADEAPIDGDTEDAARQNTTLGPALTLGAKGLIKKDKIKTVVSDSKKQIKSGKKAAARKFKKAKGKVLTAKADYVQKKANGKMDKALKAADNFKAEDKKLKELQEKRKKLKAEKTKLNKLKPGVDAKGNKITHKPRLEARKANKAKELEKVNKEIAALQKQIDNQAIKVAQARAAKNAAADAAQIAKKKAATAAKAAKAATKPVAKKAATRAVAKAGGKTLLKKIPGVSFFAGLVFAADRAIHGDFAGAGMEIASGAAGCVPGIGTGVSVGIDVALAAKDLKDAKVI